MFIQNSEFINEIDTCDYCDTEFERNIPNSHLKPCRFMIWISKYYDISLEALDDGFIKSINSGIIKYGGERGWDIYEKLMKICIETFLPHQLNDDIIKNGLKYCYQYANHKFKPSNRNKFLIFNQILHKL